MRTLRRARFQVSGVSGDRPFGKAQDGLGAVKNSGRNCK